MKILIKRIKSLNFNTDFRDLLQRYINITEIEHYNSTWNNIIQNKEL